MNILFLAHDSSLYGASQSLLALVIYLKNNTNVNIKVLLPYKGVIEQKLQDANINYEIIAYPRIDYKGDKKKLTDIIKIYLKYFYQKEKSIKQLNKIILSFKPTVIYTNCIVIKIGLDLALKYNIKHVWHIREYGWEDYSLKFIGGKKKLEKNIKKSLSIFVSENLKNYWAAHSDKALVIYNGVFSNNNIINNKISTSINNYKIILPGAITKGKGQLLALQALRIVKEKIPPVTLHIFGDVLDKDYYKQMYSYINNHALHNAVHFYKFEQDKYKIYNDASILISCACREAFGRTIIEGMLNYIPVIANNSGGVQEIITHKENGLLFNNSAIELANYIILLFTNDILNNKIKTNAYKYAIDNYSVELYGSKIYQLIKE